MTGPASLVAVVTTDLAAITRGRFVRADRLDRIADTGIGWVPANLSISALGSIADPNPWGSTGDLRILPDLGARLRTAATGSPTPFDMVPGRIVELDGRPWFGCSRTLLEVALADLRAETGLVLNAAFEQEFQLLDAGLPPAHPMAFAALRRAEPFASTLVAALDEAGVEPEVVIAEYGTDQFEITHAPAPGLAAADRAVAIREITRELARTLGFRATFAPKTAPDAVGNGVHVHFSFTDLAGKPATWDPAGPGGLSARTGAFLSGILRHMTGIIALTAASRPSYLRLRPHNWSSSYTWAADRDREATLRICPVVTLGGRDPARQYNVEFRAADATANPYLVLAALVRAGLEGLRDNLPPPPLVTGDPSVMSDEQRAALGLVRLPQSLDEALGAFLADRMIETWLHPTLREAYVGLKRYELAAFAGLDDAALCARYAGLY